MFNPSRLTLARELRGLTKKVLSERTGITSRSISNFENKLDYYPSDETVFSFSKELAFPVSFFYSDDLDQPTPATASFRSMKSMSASRQKTVLTVGAIGFALDRFLNSHFNQPAADLPDLTGESPEVAAASLRHHWGLGEHPIKNVMRLLEAKGVRIYSIGDQPKEVSAYSIWHDGLPFIFTNTQKSAEHARFTMCHELGHLLLHRNENDSFEDPRRIEQEADQFASSMLMPKNDILAHCPRIATRTSLINAKKRWGVSAAALAFRLHKAGLLTDWHYRMLCIEMSKNGDRTSEPEGMPNETSDRLRQMMSALSSEGVTRRIIGEALDVFPDVIDMLLFGIVPTAIEGGGRTSAKERPKLRIV
jgi:Zn-dependent peptidase ImmA (M78 family)/DNA-binding XRE family transcriptional regulator